MTAAEKLRAWRAEKGWTQWQLASHLRVWQSAVARWERGLQIPGGEHRERIAAVTKGHIPVKAWPKREPGAWGWGVWR